MEKLKAQIIVDANNDYRLINGDFVDGNKNRFCK